MGNNMCVKAGSIMGWSLPNIRIIIPFSKTCCSLENAGVIRSALDLFLTVIQHSCITFMGLRLSLSNMSHRDRLALHRSCPQSNGLCSSKLTFYIHRVTQADYHNLQEANDCRQIQLSMQYWVIETQTSTSSPVPEHPGELTVSI